MPCLSPAVVLQRLCFDRVEALRSLARGVWSGFNRLRAAATRRRRRRRGRSGGAVARRGATGRAARRGPRRRSTRRPVGMAAATPPPFGRAPRSPTTCHRTCRSEVPAAQAPGGVPSGRARERGGDRTTAAAMPTHRPGAARGGDECGGGRGAWRSAGQKCRTLLGRKKAPRASNRHRSAYTRVISSFVIGAGCSSLVSCTCTRWSPSRRPRTRIR